MVKQSVFVAVLGVAFCLARVSQGGECPPGISCQGTKCAIDTCCKCEDWNPNGSCTEDGWTRTTGKGDCDFDLGGGGKISKECACPPNTHCEFQKTSGEGTVCECTCWDDKGLCKDGSWKVKNDVVGDCAFDVDDAPTPVVASTPSAPDVEPCVCSPGVECDDKKKSGDGTVCKCGCWDDDGKCLTNAWSVITKGKGKGSCDFEVPPPGGK